MNPQKLKNFIFKQENEKHIKMALCLLSSLIVLILHWSQSSKKEAVVPDKLKVNLSVMIPPGYVLLPFQADNFEELEALLEPYNMVKVYSISHKRLLAENIKVLRAPKDPSQLAFLVPVNIANKLASFGLEFKIMLQKYDNSKTAQLVNFKKKRKKTTALTYGAS